MSQSRTNLPIAIAGGGLGGLAAALALSRKCFDVRLFERAEEFEEIGAGVQLGPNVFRVLEQLGIADAVRSFAVFPDDLVMMDSVSGEVAARIPVTGVFQERFGQPYALVHRGDLLGALLRACRACPRIELHASAKVTGFVDRDDRVSVRLHSGETFDAAGLIGADGIRSFVRSKIVGDGPPRHSGFVAYRSLLAADEMPSELRVNRMTLWAGPRCHLVHYPLRGHDCYNFVAAFQSAKRTEEWNTEGDPKELRGRFATAVPVVWQMLERIKSWRMWMLCDRDPIKQWSLGRVTLLGDAAHPMLQYVAQGAGMALEDAVVIADELSAASGDALNAFRAYEQRRYLRTARAQLTSRLYGEFFHAEGATRDVRNEFLRSRTEEDTLAGLNWLYARDACV
jgi:2-polyprenyl-6-methoxyphenol hydroxylase-like FAD-dependent oxidoreductase